VREDPGSEREARGEKPGAEQRRRRQQQQQQQPEAGPGGKQAAQPQAGADAAAAAVARASRRRRAWATASVFLASGLAHELVLAYILIPYTWGVSHFFFVMVRPAGRQGFLLPRLCPWWLSCSALGKRRLRCLVPGAVAVMVVWWGEGSCPAFFVRACMVTQPQPPRPPPDRPSAPRAGAAAAARELDPAPPPDRGPCAAARAAVGRDECAPPRVRAPLLLPAP
jgi:hypothetical protein